MSGRTTWTPKKERSFLAHLADGRTIRYACVASGLARSSVYERRESHPDFATAMDEARLAGAEIMEDEAFRRAVEGYDKPIVHQGLITATAREYSDTLLIFLLKGALPDKYRERVDSHVTGTVQADVKIHTIIVEKPADDGDA